MSHSLCIVRLSWVLRHAVHAGGFANPALVRMKPTQGRLHDMMVLTRKVPQGTGPTKPSETSHTGAFELQAAISLI